MINLVKVAKQIIEEANSEGLDLKAIGRIGVAISCGMQYIETKDIDLFGQKIREHHLTRFFKNKGFTFKYVDANLYSFERKLKNGFLLQVDVYLKELIFAYKLPGPFSPSDRYTIPITQLFLSRLFYNDNKWSVKEQQDLINILRTHQLCINNSDRKCKSDTKSYSFQFIQLKILHKTWCGNSESYSNYLSCKNKLNVILNDKDIEPDVKEKIQFILEFIRISPKKCPYKVSKCLHVGSQNKVEDAS